MSDADSDSAGHGDVDDTNDVDENNDTDDTNDVADTDGTLLVAVANTETAERLLDTAIDVATDRSYGITIVYVVEVPPQIPLSQGDSVLEDDDENVLARAEDLVADAGVPTETRIRYARDTATGIVGGADEYGADLILMGWRGRPPRRDVVLGSYLDRVLRNAPCDVLVKRIRTPQPDDVRSVLVPVTRGVHNQFAREVAGSICRRHGASLTVCHVIPEDPTDEDRERGRALLDETARHLDGITVDQELLESDHVAGTITDRTADYDVTILGATEESLLRRKLLGTVSEAVGRHAAGTVMIAQRHPSRATEQDTRSG